MPVEPPEWVREVISPPRFAPYLARAAGDTAAAIRLYWWNVEVSAAFYLPLHCLELALRNSMHQQLRIRFGRNDWWVGASLDDYGQRTVSDAVRKAARRGGGQCTADDVVAELPLGFWVSLISRGASYDRTLWVPALHRAFPYYRESRRTLHDNLLTIVLFRNRIMHHEPIHHRDLRADHAKIYQLINYISPSMASELALIDPVVSVLGKRDEIFPESRDDSL
jgi:hypothetical protein